MSKKKVIKSESDVTLEITPPFIIGFFTLESSYSVQCFSVYYAKISPFRGDFALKTQQQKNRRPSGGDGSIHFFKDAFFLENLKIFKMFTFLQNISM